MAEHVLCDAGLSVRIDGSGDRTLVVVKDGAVARFWTDTAELEAVLDGFPLQLSAHDGSCLLSMEANEVVATFSLAGGPTQTCRMSSSILRAALQAVREARDEENFTF